LRTPGNRPVRKEIVMLKFAFIALAGGAALASAAVSKLPQKPVYFDAGQYSAALSQGARQWRLQPLAGDDVEVIDRACMNRTHVPVGVWIVSRDGDGHLQLLAPSSTILPTGYPQQIALRACGDAGADTALQVPPVVLGWIENNVNSVLIDD
jgi:hypothetical protein